MDKQTKSDQPEIVEEYSRAVTYGGVSVRSRCTLVTKNDKVFYQILLDAAGQRAIIDIPKSRERSVEKILREALHGFATSVALRLDKNQRLRP